MMMMMAMVVVRMMMMIMVMVITMEFSTLSNPVPTAESTKPGFFGISTSQRAQKIKKQGFRDCQRARKETLYIGDMRRRSAASHATKKPIFGVTFGCLFLG